MSDQSDLDEHLEDETLDEDTSAGSSAAVPPRSSEDLKNALERAIADVQKDMQSRLDAAQAPPKMGLETPSLDGKKEKKTRWTEPDAPGTRVDNIITCVTDLYYGKKDRKRNSSRTMDTVPTVVIGPPPPQMSMPMMCPPPIMMPPPMLDPYGRPMLPPPGLMPPPPPHLMGMGMMVPPPTMSTASDAPPSQKRARLSDPPDSAPRVHLKIGDLDLPTGTSKSMVANGGYDVEEDDENQLFVKLLYRKLQSIKNKKRVEALHVDIMSLVKRAATEEESDSRDARDMRAETQTTTWR